MSRSAGYAKRRYQDCLPKTLQPRFGLPSEPDAGRQESRSNIMWLGAQGDFAAELAASRMGLIYSIG